jgi:hypothetical protein
VSKNATKTETTTSTTEQILDLDYGQFLVSFDNFIYQTESDLETILYFADIMSLNIIEKEEFVFGKKVTLRYIAIFEIPRILSYVRSLDDDRNSYSGLCQRYLSKLDCDSNIQDYFKRLVKVLTP